MIYVVLNLAVQAISIMGTLLSQQHSKSNVARQDIIAGIMRLPREALTLLLIGKSGRVRYKNDMSNGDDAYEKK